MAFKDNAVELEERVVAVNRVTKVVKGGRRLRFAALVVVGDRNGRVGFGTGKAQEVPEAIRKAVEDAKKNLIEVTYGWNNIPHEVLSEFGGAKVLLKPAGRRFWSCRRWCSSCRCGIGRCGRYYI